jgi:anaerobic ribonucleoside-triphosphate reductase
MEIQRWSCHTCHTHFELDKAEKEVKCPKCGETHLEKRCIADPEGGCHCALSVNSGAVYCPVCNRPICPTCGDHDVAQVSRVTGYLSDVAGWNNAKKQELKDRNRTKIVNGEVMV